jgi:hypothetical protein
MWGEGQGPVVPALPPHPLPTRLWAGEGGAHGPDFPGLNLKGLGEGVRASGTGVSPVGGP